MSKLNVAFNILFALVIITTILSVCLRSSFTTEHKVENGKKINVYTYTLN